MIRSIQIRDARYNLANGAGSDAIHREPVYSYAVTELLTDNGLLGSGLAFTLGAGNELVCEVARFYAQQLVGKDIEDIMSNFGSIFNQLSNEQQMRWLGPHKGVVHLALASVTNACFDLWAKRRGVPLWKLLIDLTPEELLATLDLSYLEDELTHQQALELLRETKSTQALRETVLQDGYPGYDTSVGWFNYSNDQLVENAKKAVDNGFTAMKLKVGSKNPARDIERAMLIRQTVGDGVKIMLDVNQQWTLPQTIQICGSLKEMNPYWIEEPTHPDDVLAHKTIAAAIAPIKLAIGEHVPNRIIFKNYLQTGSVGFLQVDAVRVGGVSEFITVSLLSKKFNVPVVPHVGDMGQLHQHLVLFNRIALDHELVFLEHIPHLKKYFTNPVTIKNGVYVTPLEPGSSCNLI